MMDTANIKFNRVVAKNNFKFSDMEELKAAVERSILGETGLIVAGTEKKAKEILTSDGTLEIQKSVAGEAIAFLSDETAVNVRLIQLNAHGLFKFVYLLKVRLL
jgi:hypothetical protein